MSANSYLIWFLAALFYAYQNMLRVIPNILKSNICETFQYDDIYFGQFASAWYLGYALAHIPLGIAFDRYGLKYLLPLCPLLCVIGIAPLPLLDHQLYPIAGRFLWGVGSAGATLGMFKLVRETFENHLFTKMLSISCVIGFLGAIVGSAPIYYLLNFYDWKSILLTICLLGILLSLSLLYVIKKAPLNNIESPLSTIKLLLSNKWLWIISLGAGFLAGPFEGYADAWAMQSLSSIYQISNTLSSQATSIMTVGLILGFFTIPYIINTLGLEKTVILSGFSMTISFVLLISGKIPLWFAVIQLLILGFFTAYQIPAISRAYHLFPKKHTSLVTAIFNMIMMIFGAFFHTIIGTCMNHFSFSAPIVNGSCQYNAEFYQKGFIIIPIMLILGIIFFIFVCYKAPKHIQISKETH